MTRKKRPNAMTTTADCSSLSDAVSFLQSCNPPAVARMRYRAQDGSTGPMAMVLGRCGMRTEVQVAALFFGDDAAQRRARDGVPKLLGTVVPEYRTPRGRKRQRYTEDDLHAELGDVLRSHRLRVCH